MILTHLPDLPPAPATAANAAFRRDFYARWGRENAVVCGTATRAEYGTVTQTLSIKTAWGGRECYFLPRREVAVDDDNLLILNGGLAYGSRLALAGALSAGSMVLASDAAGPTRQRITWTPNADGSVRQLWETSADAGKTWTVAFDGRYVRRR